MAGSLSLVPSATQPLSNHILPPSGQDGDLPPAMGSAVVPRSQLSHQPHRFLQTTPKSLGAIRSAVRHCTPGGPTTLAKGTVLCKANTSEGPQGQRMAAELLGEGHGRDPGGGNWEGGSSWEEPQPCRVQPLWAERIRTRLTCRVSPRDVEPLWQFLAPQALPAPPRGPRPPGAGRWGTTQGGSSASAALSLEHPPWGHSRAP